MMYFFYKGDKNIDINEISSSLNLRVKDKLPASLALAFVGTVVGMIPAFLLIAIRGIISGLLLALVPVASFFGYKLGKGPKTKVATISVCVIFIVVSLLSM